jgi:hypothetical protein
MLSRIKFDIDALVNNILDQFPIKTWKSTTTTFLDPAIGGGQFIRAIEQRLRQAGHSDENIAGRVFGCESSKLNVQYARNKYKLVATLGVGNFLNKDFGNMRFDNVVGNPPYQSGNGEKGGARSLWRKFIKKSFDLVKADGYVGIVCPGFPYQSNDLGKYFTKNTPIFLNNDVSNYFPGIGSNIKAWVIQQGIQNKTFVVDNSIWSNGLTLDPTENNIVRSIKSKIKSFSKFECKQDKGYNSTQFKNDSTDYFENPTNDSIYPIRHASTVKICYVKKPTECHNKRKVMMTFSGYPSFEYYDEKTPMSSCYQMSGYIEVKNKKEANFLIKLFNTKLYKFLSSHGSAGMRGVTNYSLPKIDISREWHDSEIYSHFNLTQEEIDYIESTIK